tara:strand:+ start:32 stop:619 length:588 start_codon:yes stop_codon:yes gene_type:complete
MIHKFNIPDNIYNELMEDIKNSNKKYNKNLVGNIKQEFDLSDYRDKYEKFIITKAVENKNLIDTINEIDILFPNDQPFTLGKLWVNFQSKYEFNPIHNHSGVFSFILFLKIPFLIQDELKQGPGEEANENLAGYLQFLKIDQNTKGSIISEKLAVDKTWEKKGLIFRSYLNHCVNPFYSSDDYRITVSGNIYFKN